MYRPSHCISEDAQEVWRLMDENPFATLMAHTPAGPFVSHLPIIGIKGEGATRLFGHMSRSNDQWKHFKNDSAALAVFHGPHTFVTPRWYSEHDVPTWSYAVVHVHGRIRLLEEPRDLLRILKQLTDRFETGPDAWPFALTDEFKTEGALKAAIIGFELEIERLEPKFKLGQNRTQIDRDGIRSGLAARDDENSKGILELLNRLGV